MYRESRFETSIEIHLAKTVISLITSGRKRRSSCRIIQRARLWISTSIPLQNLTFQNKPHRQTFFSTTGNEVASKETSFRIVSQTACISTNYEHCVHLRCPSTLSICVVHWKLSTEHYPTDINGESLLDSTRDSTREAPVSGWLSILISRYLRIISTRDYLRVLSVAIIH